MINYLLITVRSNSSHSAKKCSFYKLCVIIS